MVVKSLVGSFDVLSVWEEPLEVIPTVDERLGDENIVYTKNQPEKGEKCEIDANTVDAQVVRERTKEGEVVQNLDDCTEKDNDDCISLIKKLFFRRKIKKLENCVQCVGQLLVEVILHEISQQYEKVKKKH